MASKENCGSIKWQSQQLGIKTEFQVETDESNDPTTKYTFDATHLVKGVQDASYDTNFNTEPVFQMCQGGLYELVEGIPVVDFNVTKSLDGWCPVYTRATADAKSPTLFGRAPCASTVAIGIYPCTAAYTGEEGCNEPKAIAIFPDIQVSSLGYTFSADGTGFTEDVSFTGNNVIWWNAENTAADGSYVAPCTDLAALDDCGDCSDLVDTFQTDYMSIEMAGVCTDCDETCSSPRTKIGTSEDFIFQPVGDDSTVAESTVLQALMDAANGDLTGLEALELDANCQLCDPCMTTLPSEVLTTASVTEGSGADSAQELAASRLACCLGINMDIRNGEWTGKPKLCVQSISINTDFNREDVNCLGLKGPKTRTITPPISVTTAIEVTSECGAQISALQNGVFQRCQANKFVCQQSGLNLKDQTIRLVTCGGLFIYLGTKNKLQSVSTTGGGTDGSNLTVTYTYETFNTLTVMHLDEGNCNPNSLIANQADTGWLAYANGTDDTEGFVLSPRGESLLCEADCGAPTMMMVERSPVRAAIAQALPADAAKKPAKKEEAKKDAPKKEEAKKEE